MKNTAGEKRYALILYWKLLNRLDMIDHHIYHSFSTRVLNEGTHLRKSSILVPQFLLEDEVMKPTERIFVRSEPSLIVTYTSTVRSPKLLDFKDIIKLFKTVKTLSRRELKVVVINPLGPGIDVGWLKVLPMLPRAEYLKLVRKADIYFERCIDEELGYATFEAAQLGTTIAKLTTTHKEHQDYDATQMLLAEQADSLSVKITNYINYPHSAYAEEMLSFIRRKRTWNGVKRPLIKALEI
jgi:hypothetical protein